MRRVVNEQGGTGARGRVPGVAVAGKTGTAQFWRDGKKDNHTWFIAFAPYDKPRIALSLLVQGAKAGSEVPAPLASKIIEEILALDRGYDPGVKPLDPAIGNFNFVQSINFKNNNTVPAQVAATDEETSDDAPETNDAPHKVARAQAAEPDIRPDADDHKVAQRPQPASQERKRNFFDFFHRKPKETQQPNQQQSQDRTGEKKKRFLIF
jgi:penicillin-binding protein 2